MSFTVVGPMAHEVQSADRIELVQPFLGMSEEEFRKLATSVMALVIHRTYEGINGKTTDAMGLWAKCDTPVARLEDPFSGFIEVTRAGMARTFLQYVKDRPQVEYLCMMDSDEAVPWDAPYKLAQWGKDIVSGVVCSNSERKGGIFACFTVKDKYGISRFPSVTNTKFMPTKGLIEAEHAGTGLLCVHKRVFEAIAASGDYPFFIPEEVRRHSAATGSLKLGEDMAFSEQARRLGFKTYVDLSVRAPHYKVQAIQWFPKYLDDSLDCRDWQVSTEDGTPAS